MTKGFDVIELYNLIYINELWLTYSFNQNINVYKQLISNKI